MRETTYWLDIGLDRLLAIEAVEDVPYLWEITDSDRDHIMNVTKEELPQFIASLRWLADELEKDFPA